MIIYLTVTFVTMIVVSLLTTAPPKERLDLGSCAVVGVLIATFVWILQL